MLFSLVYVDDVEIIWNNNQQLQEFVDNLNTCFVFKDMRSLSQLLGLEVHRDATGLHFIQTKYVVDLLEVWL